MKCLLVADLHYDLRKFDWVLAAAAHVDVVVLAGDHLEIASMVARPAQTIVVQKYFRRIQAVARLLVSSGNHDLDGEDAGGELAAKWLAGARHMGVPADGDSVLIRDTLFTLCAWWDGDKRKAEIAAQLARDAAEKAPKWIWVHHAPPEGSPTSWGGKRSFGDATLRRWIEEFQPDIVLSGHVHQSPYVTNGSWADRIGKTWVFNAGHQVGPVPSHVVVDTAEPKAYWLSLTAGQSATLDQPATLPMPGLESLPDWLAAMVRQANQILR